MSSRTKVRIGAALASLASIAGIVLVNAPAAHAVSQEACRSNPVYGPMSVWVKPCVDLVDNFDGHGDWLWKPTAYAYSPQTDVRVYVQLGRSDTPTSPINWNSGTGSGVVGPSGSQHYVDPGVGVIGNIYGCWWGRSWVTDNNVTIISDAESPYLCL